MLHAANRDRPLGPPGSCPLEGQVRAMFQRVLASWATDALSLRRRGLDRPVSRAGGGSAVAPPGPAGAWVEIDYPGRARIGWIPQRELGALRISEL